MRPLAFWFVSLFFVMNFFVADLPGGRLGESDGGTLGTVLGLVDRLGESDTLGN